MRQQLGRVPEEVAFVYGHTHKPFVDQWSVPGFPAPVSIANTGGWVVDTAAPAPVQAGVAVLVNENLDAASLQFYRQSPGSAPVPVQLLPPPAGGRPSAWHAELASGSTRQRHRGRRCRSLPRSLWPSATGSRPRPSLSATPPADPEIQRGEPFREGISSARMREHQRIVVHVNDRDEGAASCAISCTLRDVGSPAPSPATLQADYAIAVPL